MLCTTSYVITDLKRPLMAFMHLRKPGKMKTIFCRCVVRKVFYLTMRPSIIMALLTENLCRKAPGTIYTGYGTSRMVADGIKVFTVKKELLDIGKEIVKTSYGHDIPLYNRERTICDLIRSRNRFEIQDFQTALKTYIMGKNKNLNRLMEYAKLFHVDKKIREYMEVLL